MVAHEALYFGIMGLKAHQTYCQSKGYFYNLVLQVSSDGKVRELLSVGVAVGLQEEGHLPLPGLD